ncbi:C2 domain protein [Ostertagia ostertagi]
MDIWDHDDEEQSVLDAVSSLNQITGGFKGLGRFFKEVAQSARADSDDTTDDFLGCISMNLSDIPPDGIEHWFPLQPRSEKSKVSGSVKLKLWLSTREERLGAEEDDLLDVKEHIELMRQFALYEIRLSGAPVRLWDGVFPDKANTILRQHALQGDLTEVHTAMCRWLAFHSMIPIDISFSLLAKTLQNIQDKWQPMTLDKAEEDMLTASFSAFDTYCKRSFAEHRRRFHPSKRNAAEEFASLVRCMRALRDSQFYQKYLPYKRPFHAHLESLIIKSAEDFFDETIESVQDEDPCKELLKLMGVINGSCSRFQQYANVIREVGRIDYCQLTLSTWDRMLNEYLTSEMMSERKTDLRSQMKISANQDPPNEDDLVDLIRIHMAFVELRNYRLANRVRGKDESEWYGIFNRGIKNFLELAKEKALARISLSCQLDVPICTSSNDMRHSSSHIDVCHIVEQMTVCWDRIDVSELTLRIDYTRDFVDILCDIVITYTKKIFSNLDAEGFSGELQVFVPSPLLQLLCSAINNCEQVRRSLMIHEKLHLDDLAITYERAGHGAPTWKTAVEQRLEQTDATICAEIDRVVGLLTSRLKPQMKKHVFHLAWSPTAHPVEDSLKPLTDMIDIELSAVHKNLLHKNFLRVMSAQVGIVVHLLKECVDENPGMEPAFYHRLFEAWHVLVDFFHAGGKGLSMEVLETCPQHVALVKLLSLNQTPTQQLIEKYYKDLLKQQALAEHNANNEVSECKYGILNVRAYYNANSQTLVLDVIGAKQVIPLDANGLSDPFVVIRLVPKYRYPTQAVSKTRVVSKTLNPIFDETFEFHIPPKLPPCAMLHFTVMDHDYLRSNDFAGEAFLELADVPGFGVAGGNTLRQFNLILIQPVQNNKEIIDVLTSRKEDKEALEFLRSITTAY